MSRASQFRNLLSEKDVVAMPGTFNALVAKLIEAKGFSAVYCTGAGITNSLLGLPDISLISLFEMTQIVGYICQAVNLPVISDADVGFGNAINVIRTVQEFEKAGVAGIHIEDQVMPKKCGHVAGKELIPVEEMVGKIKAAVSAKRDKDFFIIARTDSKAVEGMKGVIKRAHLYIEAGADAIFPEALENEDEFYEFARELKGITLIGNMTEFGRTKYLSVQEFKQMGYKVVLFPVSTQRVAMKATEDFLIELYKKGTQKDYLKKMQTRKELYDLINYAQYTEWENKYLSEGGVDPLSGD